MTWIRANENNDPPWWNYKARSSSTINTVSSVLIVHVCTGSINRVWQHKLLWVISWTAALKDNLMFKKALAFCPGHPNLYRYLQYIILFILLSASFTWESPRAITKAETKPCLKCKYMLDNFVGFLIKNLTRPMNYLLCSHSNNNNKYLNNTFYNK